MLRRGSRQGWTWRRPATAAAVIAVMTLTGCHVGNVSSGKVHRVVDVTLNAEGKAGFTPLTTTVQKGDFVTIVVINRTDKIHGFSIRGYNVPPIQVGPDAPNNVVFTAKREGTYEIFCQLHPAHMKAALLVE